MQVEATEFVTDAEHRLAAMSVEQQRAEWVAAITLPYDTPRKLDLIKLSLTTPGPSDPEKTAELARIAAEMDAMYGTAKYHDLDVEAITKIMQTDREPKRLLDVWRGWHSIGRPLKPLYSRFVELTNEGGGNR